MKKRLRKKKRVGEFAELGFRFCGVFETELSPDKGDEFFDKLIEYVEAHDLGVGGGCGYKNFDLMTSHMPRKKKGRGFTSGSCTEEHREIVKKFLMSISEIEEFEIGQLVDMWHVGDEKWDRSVASKWEVVLGYQK